MSISPDVERTWFREVLMESDAMDVCSCDDFRSKGRTDAEVDENSSMTSLMRVDSEQESEK